MDINASIVVPFMNKQSIHDSKPGQLLAKSYQFGYRGIWFNLALLLLVSVSSYTLFDRAISVIHNNQPDWLVGSLLIVAVILETYLCPIKLKDILNHQPAKLDEKSRKRLHSLAFYLLFFGTTIGFIALSLAFIAFGKDPSNNENILGTIGFIITLRFLYFIITKPAIDEEIKTPVISLKKASYVDLGIAFYSSIYYVCIWQVLVISKVNLEQLTESPASLTMGLIGVTGMILLCLIPIRALYFLEEWRGNLSTSSKIAIFISLALLIIETLFHLLTPVTF